MQLLHELPSPAAVVEAVNVVTAQITAASVPVLNNLNISW